MPKSITITLSEDEADMILDALETDSESYTESAAAARKEGDTNALTTFREAAARIVKLRERLQSIVDAD
jgi:hypothetical protein